MIAVLITATVVIDTTKVVMMIMTRCAAGSMGPLASSSSTDGLLNEEEGDLLQNKFCRRFVGKGKKGDSWSSGYNPSDSHNPSLNCAQFYSVW